MKIFTIISRLLVGSLFIVSGLIKANDPVGFSYKLKDYFAPDVLNMEWLVPYVLPMAVLICAVEIVLGIATVLGVKMKPVSWLLIGMIVFFTFLTFYSAYFEKVTDCGCFGDALKLTPWQSFTKDVILLVFVSIIFFQRNKIEVNTNKEDLIFLIVSLVLIAAFSLGIISWGFPILFSAGTFAVVIALKRIDALRPKYNWIALGLPTIFCLLFSFHVLAHLPIKDFRPYALGKSIPDQMVIPEGAPVDEYLNIWYYKDKDGNTKEYSDADKPWENSDLTFVDRESILIKKGYEPPVYDFSISSLDGEDLTYQFLSAVGYYFFLVAYDITDPNNIEVKDAVNKLATACTGANIPFIGLTSSSYENIDIFRHEVQAMYDYYTTDEKTLQTIVRSNPALLLLKDGIIMGKWHYNDIPDFEQVKKLMAADN